MTATRKWFLVDTDGMADDQRGDVCRAVLGAVSSDVDSYQCDIPFSPEWPADVLRAAVHLRDADGDHPHDGSYILTGVFRNDDPVRWQSFVTFAPWTYTAGAWVDGEPEQRVSVSDEATSIALWLTEDQQAAISELVGADRLLTEDQNRLRRHRARGCT